MNTMSPVSSQDALLAICLFAAFADGEKSGEEREEIRRLAEEIGSQNLAGLSRQILMRKLSLDSVVAGLASQEDRLLAYEMALGICEAGGSVSAEEQDFLSSLREHLGLGAEESRVVENEVSSIVLAPVATTTAPQPAPENGSMIIKYAIVNGALELLPETLATMAIVPLQMKMVFRIAKSHGVELGASNIKEFLATAGLGLGSQMVEGFARKLMRGVGRKLGGKLAGKAADQITGSALSFAATYAIGHVAEKYYSAGGRLDSSGLKSLFTSFQGQAGDLHKKYLPEIQARATTLDRSTILSMIGGSTPV